MTRLDAEILADPSVVLLQDVVILTKRMALPFFWKQDALQIRMTREANAKHVEDLALKPVRDRPDGNEAGNFFVCRQWNLQAQARVVREGIENSDEIEAFFAARPVNGCVILEQVELLFVA